MRDYVTRLKNLVVDLPGKDLTLAAIDAGELAAAYGLAAAAEAVRDALERR